MHKICCQGGPGSSSMFGALKLHGPVLTTVDEDNNLNGVGSNPYTWARKHNVIYIDNPVGAGEKIVSRICQLKTMILRILLQR